MKTCFFIRIIRIKVYKVQAYCTSLPVFSALGVHTIIHLNICKKSARRGIITRPVFFLYQSLHKMLNLVKLIESNTKNT